MFSMFERLGLISISRAPLEFSPKHNQTIYIVDDYAPAPPHMCQATQRQDARVHRINTRLQRRMHRTVCRCCSIYGCVLLC